MMRLLVLTTALFTAHLPGVIAVEQCNNRLIDRLLEVIETELIPMTRKSVAQGNKVFGATMLNKSDLSTIIAASNHETENPLWHFFYRIYFVCFSGIYA